MVLNELSFAQSAPDIPTARQWMSQFINVLHQIKIGRVNKILRTHQEWSTHLLAPDYSLAQWRNDPDVEREQRQFLRTLAHKSPFLVELPEKEKESLAYEFSLAGKKISNPSNQICGLGAAYLLNSLAVSLLSDPKWDTSRLNLQMELLNEDGNIEEPQSISVEHASAIEHLQEHQEWIKKWVQRQVKNGIDLWERRTELFPSLIFCEPICNRIMSFTEGHLLFYQVVKRLFELEDYAQNWPAGTAFDKDKLPSKATPESSSRLQQYKDDFIFMCPDGKKRLFSWHVRLTPSAWRIHFIAEKPGQIIIGYIGEKIRK